MKISCIVVCSSIIISSMSKFTLLYFKMSYTPGVINFLTPGTLNVSNHRGHETFFQKIEEILIDYSDSHTNLMHAHTHFVVVVVVAVA